MNQRIAVFSRPHLLPVLLSVSLLFCACTKKSDAPSSTQAATAGGSKVVNLAIWSNYVAQDLLNDFEKRTGIRVQISSYSSNEELLAKLQAGASGYDVVVPSDYMVFVMAKLGLARELDRTQIPNSRSLDPKYLKRSFDPENKYSVPYNWGTTGIAVNRSLYKGEIKGWKDLFNNPDLAGKYSMLDDVRETLGAALKSLGYSLNTKNPEELGKAKDLLLKTRSRVKSYTSEPRVPLSSGELAVAHAFSTDALQAGRATVGKVEFVIPEEGCTLWLDNFVIPASAPHVKEAYAFIDFLLDAKNATTTAQNVLVAPVNKEAIPLLPPVLQQNKSLFPPESALAKCEMLEDPGEGLAVWDRLWTEVKAAAQ
jgi:spermidine/putrescine transport system substrate-binding protein